MKLSKFRAPMLTLLLTVLVLSLVENLYSDTWFYAKAIFSRYWDTRRPYEKMVEVFRDHQPYEVATNTHLSYQAALQMK